MLTRIFDALDAASDAAFFGSLAAVLVAIVLVEQLLLPRRTP